MNLPAANLEGEGTARDRLAAARVLVELGETYDAERELSAMLEDKPDDLDALSLLAKVKHIRGELSQAIACWAHIQVLAPPPERTQAQLAALLSMATEPERGAGDFLALSQPRQVRSPSAYLEVEAAFVELAAGRFEDARRKCLRAAGVRRRDRDAHKLTTLAAAWVCELVGRLDEACEILESLGLERGFETDVDRVLMLARLYERDGSTERLESALHIWRYFEQRSDRIEIPSRIGQLLRRLGKLSQAVEYERRYERAFLTRMHRPFFGELVQVAARRYLPLMQLKELPLRDPEIPGHPARARALGLALTGEPAAARAALEQLGTPLDAKYCADLTLMAGDVAGAAHAYLEVLRADPEEVRVLRWLLARYAQEPWPELAKAFDGPLGAQARGVLERQAQAHPARPSVWRQRATLARLSKQRPDAEYFDARARAIELARQRDAHPIGRVLSAAVYRYVGRSKGLIHEVWADREPAAPNEGGRLPDARVFGSLSPQLQSAIQSTFLAVREYARSKFPHLTAGLMEHTYSFKVTKEDERSHGSSALLPAAIAFLSVFLQRPVPQTIALTGELVADSHDVLTVRAVGDTEYKVKAACHRNLKALVVPRANQPELTANPRIPESVRNELVRYASDLDAAVALVFGAELFVG